MNAFFAALERASLFGFVALIGALLFQMLLDKRVPASWRVWLWRVALLQTALALMPLTPLHLAVLPSRAIETMPSASTIASAPISASPALPIAVPPAVSAAKVAPLRSPISAVSTTRPLPIWLLLMAFYSLGLAVQLAVLARSARRVRRKIEGCSLVEDADIQLQLRHVAREMRVSPLPRLLKCDSGAPFLASIFRPIIVLPRPLLTPHNRDLEAVLWHELAHLKRRDLVWNAFLWLVQSVLWFHPLVWVARHFLSLETESACDEMVLSSTRIAPKSYGVLLLNTMNHPTSPLTAGITDGFFALKTRLVRLNRAPKCPRRAWQVVFAMALGFSLMAALPLRFVARAQDKAPSVDAGKVKAKRSIIRTIRGRRIPMDDTPEASVGLPATLEAARGNATITGRVIYENGKPAAGIKVDAYCVWLSQTELWGYKRNRANHYRFPEKINKLLSAKAVTRADGTYRFTGLLPQNYGINLGNYGINRAPVGLLAPEGYIGITAVANRTRRAPDTVLRRSAVVRIRAIDQNSGVPLEGVAFRGYLIDESGGKLMASAVDAHQGMRPMKGFDSYGTTDKNGYCTLSLDAGKAYFYMDRGSQMTGMQQDKISKRWFGLPTLIITNRGLYKIEDWCEVTSRSSPSKSRRSWKGETEFQLKRGPAANFIVKLKRDRPLSPKNRELLPFLN